MPFKIIVVLVLIVIAVSLFSALRTLVRNKDNDKQRTVRFLAIRVGFSVCWRRRAPSPPSCWIPCRWR